MTIMDNFTTYKYNRNFNSFVTLEESVEPWRRGKIPKIYFLLQFLIGEKLDEMLGLFWKKK